MKMVHTSPFKDPNLLNIIRHWNPSIKQMSAKYVYTSDFCFICGHHNKYNKRTFRVNTKLGVFKCYQCGSGGRSVESIQREIKRQKENLEWQLNKDLDYHFRPHLDLPF